MPWLIAIVLTCVLPTTSAETIAENDFRFISYHGELIFKCFSCLNLNVIYTTASDMNLVELFIVHSRFKYAEMLINSV